MVKVDYTSTSLEEVFKENPEEAQCYIVDELRNTPSTEFLSTLADILERSDVKLTGKSARKPKLTFQLMEFMWQKVDNENINLDAAAAEAKDVFGVGRSTACDALKEYREAEEITINELRESLVKN